MVHLKNITWSHCKDYFMIQKKQIQIIIDTTCTVQDIELEDIMIVVVDILGNMSYYGTIRVLLRK